MYFSDAYQFQNVWKCVKPLKYTATDFYPYTIKKWNCFECPCKRSINGRDFSFNPKQATVNINNIYQLYSTQNVIMPIRTPTDKQTDWQTDRKTEGYRDRQAEFINTC